MNKYLILAALIIFFVKCAEAQELRAVLSQAVEYYSAGNCEEALPLFEDIISSKLSAVHDNATLLYSLNYYAGYCSRALLDRDRAVKYFSSALTFAEKQNRQDQLPVINTFLGESERDSGNYLAASDYYMKAVKYLPDESVDTATVLYFLAEAHRGEKKYAQFFSVCERVTAMAKKFSLAKLEIECMTGAGEVYYEKGDYPQAINILSNALIASKSAQLPIETANNHMGLAIVYENLNKTDLARQNYEEALKLYVASASIANVPAIIEHLLALPSCPPAQAAKSAELHSVQAKELLRIGDEESYLYMQLLVGEYLRQAGSYAKAIAVYRSAVELAVQNDFSAEAAKVSIALSNVQYEMNDHTGASETLLKAIQFQLSQDPPTYLASIYAQQGDIYTKTSRSAQARQSYQNAVKSAVSNEEKEKYEDILKSLK